MPIKAYWITWLALLLLTAAMIFAGSGHWPKIALFALLLGAMLVKAVLIGGIFMHLRAERLVLVLVVVLSIGAVSAILFFGIAADGARVGQLSSR